MNSHHRPLRPPRSASTVTVIVFLLATSWSTASPAATESASSRSDSPDQAATPAVQEFEQRLAEYLTLRRSLADKLMPLAPTASPRELASRQAEMTTALRTARAAAKPGDLVPSSVAAQIHRLILEDFAQRTAADERGAFSEVPQAPQPAINRSYPANTALATLPPLLLLRLPRLPENLQYRFYGRHLLLLDSDTLLIVDYIPNVLPAH